jgi:hypothetical protein
MQIDALVIILTHIPTHSIIPRFELQLAKLQHQKWCPADHLLTLTSWPRPYLKVFDLQLLSSLFKNFTVNKKKMFDSVSCIPLLM